MEVFATGVRRSSVAQDMMEARTVFGKLAERLMTRYTELLGYGFAILVRQFQETRPWMTGGEPRRVSPLWDQIVRDITLHEGLVEVIYANEDGGGSRPASGAYAVLPSRERVGILRRAHCICTLTLSSKSACGFAACVAVARVVPVALAAALHSRGRPRSHDQRGRRSCRRQHRCRQGRAGGQPLRQRDIRRRDVRCR